MIPSLCVWIWLSRKLRSWRFGVRAFKQALIKSFDNLRTNGKRLIPFVASLSNHEWNQLFQSFLKLASALSYPLVPWRIISQQALFIAYNEKIKNSCNVDEIYAITMFLLPFFGR